jgi:hypothetical protein
MGLLAAVSIGGLFGGFVAAGSRPPAPTVLRVAHATAQVSKPVAATTIVARPATK